MPLILQDNRLFNYWGIPLFCFFLHCSQAASIRIPHSLFPLCHSHAITPTNSAHSTDNCIQSFASKSNIRLCKVRNIKSKILNIDFKRHGAISLILQDNTPLKLHCSIPLFRSFLHAVKPLPFA